MPRDTRGTLFPGTTVPERNKLKLRTKPDIKLDGFRPDAHNQLDHEQRVPIRNLLATLAYYSLPPIILLANQFFTANETPGLVEGLRGGLSAALLFASGAMMGRKSNKTHFAGLSSGTIAALLLYPDTVSINTELGQTITLAQPLLYYSGIALGALLPDKGVTK